MQENNSINQYQSTNTILEGIATLPIDPSLPDLDTFNIDKLNKDFLAPYLPNVDLSRFPKEATANDVITSLELDKLDTEGKLEHLAMLKEIEDEYQEAFLEEAEDKNIDHLLDKNKRYASIFGKDFDELPDDYHLLVSEDGEDIIDVKMKKKLHQSISGGYKQVSISRDGQRRQYQAHRLVALGWIYRPKEDIGYVVNHRDGDGLNNHRRNLEWVTKATNNQYAIAQRERVDVRGGQYWVFNIKNNEFIQLYSAKQVAARTGIRYEQIDKYLDTPIKTSKGLYVIFDETGKPMGHEGDYNPKEVDWKSLPFEDVRKKCDPNSMNVKATNIKTKEVVFFSGPREASKYTGISEASISQKINSPNLNDRAIQDWYFQEVIDQGAARDWLRLHGKLVSVKNITNINKRIPLRVTDRQTGEIMQFDWIGDFVAYASKKHGYPYNVKNTQKAITSKWSPGKQRYWKEFDIDYLK